MSTQSMSKLKILFRKLTSSVSRKKNKSTMTSQGTLVEMSPRRRRTSRASIHHMSPMEWALLLLHGMAISTKRRGLSVLQNPMTGMLT